MRPTKASLLLTAAFLLIFSLCAIGDFVWSYVKGRSIAEGVVGAVIGLFGTAWHVFLFLESRKDKVESDNSSDDPRQMGRWVP
jgi:hypothetical protein